MTDAPRVGDVWNFPFLWKSEERCDETEGRKHRPCALVLLARLDTGIKK